MSKLKNILQSFWIQNKMVENKQNKSKEFILEFFKDSNISEANGVLTISEVPSAFEEFVGKKSPYKLVFDFSAHNRVKDSELIMQGSYFLVAIRDYLADKGQTSLLKINIKPDLIRINNGVGLKGKKIIEIQQNGSDYISEFSFLSTYQYLNEKKQSLNKFLIKDKRILDLDLVKLKLQNGHKDDLPNLDLNLSYLAAKSQLNNQKDKEIKPIKALLKVKLDREIHRIKDHYLKQIKEKDEEVETCEKKIKLLQSKLRHTYYDRDISIINMHIRESKARLENLKKKGYQKRLKTEEAFHITDEIEKHALSIKTNLINVTTFYYPLYELKVVSRAVSAGKKTSSVTYDPLFDRVL